MNKNIIWVASYPKSGNTWMRSLLANIIYLKDSDFNFEILKRITDFDTLTNYSFLKEEIIKDRGLEKLENISKYWIKAQKNFNLKGEKKLFKTHASNLSYLGNAYTNNETAKGAIYIIRDPRDVVISYSNHLNKSIDETIKIIQKDNTITYSHKNNFPVLMSRWDYHIMSWFNLKSPKIFIQYEHMLDNTEMIIKILVKFLNEHLSYNITITDNSIKKIIENTNFEKLKEKEKTEGFPEASKNSVFFRKGIKNQWQDILSSNQEKVISEAFYRTMKKFNYK